eukprot:jgi/Botrbrau1/17403/Bobra.0054s0001.2
MATSLLRCMRAHLEMELEHVSGRPPTSCAEKDWRRELLNKPEAVRDKVVLEVGSGTGLCGVFAAKLGAAQVTLTDYEPAVLCHLRRTVAANCAALPTQAASQADRDAGRGAEMGQEQGIDVQEEFGEFDPEDDYDSEDGFQEFDAEDDYQLQEGGSMRERMCSLKMEQEPACWDYDKMRVRFLDWKASLERTAEEGPALQIAGRTQEESTQEIESPEPWVTEDPLEALGVTGALAKESHGTVAGDAPSGGSGEDRAVPSVADQESFEVIIGSDVLYEEEHAELLPAVLSHRLARGGVAYLCLGIRSQALFDKAVATTRSTGLNVDVQAVQQVPRYGIRGDEHQYEGGFVLVTVTR